MRQATTILAGILPFGTPVIHSNSLPRLICYHRAGAAFVELYFVLSSLFVSRAYYAFGFLALTAALVALTTATVTILFTYFILCREDYRWHWRAFLTGGGSAFWLLGYGVVYWASRLSLDSFSSTVLYFGYLLLLALLDFLVTGASSASDRVARAEPPPPHPSDPVFASRYDRVLGDVLGRAQAVQRYPCGLGRSSRPTCARCIRIYTGRRATSAGRSALGIDTFFILLDAPTTYAALITRPQRPLLLDQDNHSLLLAAGA